MSSASPATSEIEAITGRLQHAVRRRFGSGAGIDRIDVATVGASNRTILFDLVDSEVRRRLVFRQENYTLAYTPFIDPHIQFELLQVAYDEGVPVPEPIFEFDEQDDLGRGYVVAFVAGETLPKRLLEDPEFTAARADFPRQAGTILARLHAIDTRRVSILEAVPESGDPIAAQIRHYDHYGEPQPALEFAFRWLERNRPASSLRRFVHGDFRNGNMIMNSDGIAAVLDWECAHLGDPIEDFGWLCARSWRFGRVNEPVGGFGRRDALNAAYEAAGGTPVDAEAARWWEIFALLKWALFNVMQVRGHISGERRSPVFAACGRNTCLIEYDLLMTIAGKFD